MPAVNFLTDEGSISAAVMGDANDIRTKGAGGLRVTGAQDVSTLAQDNNYCNIHVALIVLIAVGFLVLIEKNGFHSLMVEG
jgi:hypothetical protein